MNKGILATLVKYNNDPIKIDRLIVSCFVSINNLSVKKNKLVLDYLIDDTDADEQAQLTKLISQIKEKFSSGFGFEELIELFEFVISPKEKVVTGAVYTPKNIREYIVSQSIPEADPSIKIADIACGCGGFLISVANRLKDLTGNSFTQIIEENIWGLDIASYSAQRAKLVLSLLALFNGEDTNLRFNLFIGNALDFEWQKKNTIKDNAGFDVIVGNPPYVCSRNISEESKILLKKWSVTSTGHPDLYIPFFQIALENLRGGGVLGYITVNTFFKSLNARALRKYFSEKKFAFSIVDFRDEQVFKKRNTYTCICILRKSESEYVEFVPSSSGNLGSIQTQHFSRNYYRDFDNFSGWNLGNRNIINTVNRIERFPQKIFPSFSFSTGIATLNNDIYKFIPESKDREYYHFETAEGNYKIERGICRELINANKVTTEEEINNLKEKIIFPYRFNTEKKKYELISERTFKDEYPFAYKYLTANKTILAERDGGKGNYEAWFAYGRTQGLHVNGLKLFLPHITNGPSFVLCNDKRLLFCNGEAIVSDNERELLVLKRILESEIFWYYIVNTSKPYASGYFSLAKNYLKSFSIPDFTEAEKNLLLEGGKRAVLNLLLRKYNLDIDDISI